LRLEFQFEFFDESRVVKHQDGANGHVGDGEVCAKFNLFHGGKVSVNKELPGILLLMFPSCFVHYQKN